MRNRYIKFCDQNSIDDGLVREMLSKENYSEAIRFINMAKQDANQKVLSLEYLKTQIQEREMGGEKK